MVPRCFRWNAGRRRSLLAERGFEGSRGLQPADWSAKGVVAERRLTNRLHLMGFSSVAPRRARAAHSLSVSFAHGYLRTVAPRPATPWERSGSLSGAAAEMTPRLLRHKI